jgi:hypothetical protein
MPPLLVPAVTPSHGGMSAYGTKPTCLYVRYSVAMGWKADFEQAASVIVLCARQGFAKATGQRRWRNKESLSANG